MFNKVESQQRHQMDRGWVKGRWTFSFNDYYDEENNDFGNLVVLNEETIMPGKGYNMHPNQDMEIITYVLEGELEHFDDITNKKTFIKKGELQVLSAGSGVMHSERNASQADPVTYLQFWFTPMEYEIKPFYSHVLFDASRSEKKLLKLFSNEGSAPGNIGQEINFYISTMKKGEKISYQPGADSKTFIFLIEGKIDMNGNTLEKRDSIRTAYSPKLEIKSEEDSVFFLIDI